MVSRDEHSMPLFEQRPSETSVKPNQNQGPFLQLLVAEAALSHVKQFEGSIQSAFAASKIQCYDYNITTGFYEPFLKDGKLIECIHIHLSKSLPLKPTTLLKTLGRLFTPYPAFLFPMPSKHDSQPQTVNIPVFKEDGQEWDLDDLLESRIWSLWDFQSYVRKTAASGSGSSAGAGSSARASNNLAPSGAVTQQNVNKQTGGADDDKEEERNIKEVDRPETKAIPATGDPELYVNISAQIHSDFGDDTDAKIDIFQNLTVFATIKTLVPPMKPNCLDLHFEELRFQTQTYHDAVCYYQMYFSIKVDTHHDATRLLSLVPKQISKAHSEIKDIEGHKTTLTSAAGAALAVGPAPEASVRGEKSKMSEFSTSQETMHCRYQTRYEQFDHGVSWEYDIGHEYDRRYGAKFAKNEHPEYLPSASFQFPESVDPNREVDVYIASYWSLKPKEVKAKDPSPKKPSLLSRMRPKPRSQEDDSLLPLEPQPAVPKFFNICQALVLTMPFCMDHPIHHPNVKEDFYMNRPDKKGFENTLSYHTDSNGPIPHESFLSRMQARKLADVVAGSQSEGMLKDAQGAHQYQYAKHGKLVDSASTPTN